jgi:hypothetical protein
VFFCWNMKCYFTYLLILQRFLSEQMGTSAGTVNEKSSPARLSPFFLQTTFLIPGPASRLKMHFTVTDWTLIYPKCASEFFQCLSFSFVFVVVCSVERYSFRYEVIGLQGWLYIWSPELVCRYFSSQEQFSLLKDVSLHIIDCRKSRR